MNHQLNLEKTIVKRTAEIAQKNDDLAKLALFPEHNPNPVLELDFYFNMKYANEAAISIFRMPSLFIERPKEVEKIKRLLKATIKDKLTGKYNIKDGFYFEDKKFDLNIYVDNEMQYIRLYFNDITENTKLQNDLKEQNESIVDSLNYSLRIQQSILPDLVQLKDTFEDYFLLYHPKDIVSGDFYWTQRQDGKVLFALNDCTGHGVPGALMSIIGYNTLNSIISYFDLADVSDIVNGLNRYYFDLRKNSSNDLRDTMDVMILCFDKEQMCLKFSGSKQRFYIIRDNELQVYIADSYTLGFMEENSFSSGTITVKKGDIIYLFTDGYVDQFGGDRGKKFKYTRFRDLLLSVHQLPMAEQKTILEDTMSNWMKGENYHHEQIDDISVVGFKV
jgi:serine phosphatase RsbU (regulator of sigma subunit)